MNDTIMVEAVWDVIVGSFLKQKPEQDVHVLAASRIAINLLGEARKELEKYKNTDTKDDATTGNVGL